MIECSGSFKLLDFVLIYDDKAPIFSMCGFNVSIVHSNFSKYLFQFFKCVNTFSLQGPVIGPTKVLVEALSLRKIQYARASTNVECNVVVH